ncbi:MAG: HD domain-containing protein [Thermodesulfobacteriota bacterium]|nr:HD domain-containing protein [Thermodesulfobacteriota bacterium]
MKKTIELAKTYAMQHFSSARHSHDWEHTQRVHTLCMHIGDIEGADLEILSIAAYLHDIGRIYQDQSRGEVCHAAIGSDIAAKLLKDTHLPEAKKDNIIHCILSHRYRNSHTPQTKEAMVLFDADKLDATGAVGIARAYLFAGENGAMLHNCDVRPEETDAYTRDDTGYREYVIKLSKIKQAMFTKEGKRMAAERHAFMEQFFERFLLEIQGFV